MQATQKAYTKHYAPYPYISPFGPFLDKKGGLRVSYGKLRSGRPCWKYTKRFTIGESSSRCGNSS